MWVHDGITREAAHKLAIRYDAESPTATFEMPGATTSKLGAINPRYKPVQYKDAQAALNASAHRIDAEYSTPIQHHNSMELYSTTAYWDNGQLVLHEPSQYVWGLRKGAAAQLQLDEDDVRVTAPFVGGAFGGLVSSGTWAIPLSAASRLVGAEHPRSRCNLGQSRRSLAARSPVGAALMNNQLIN